MRTWIGRVLYGLGGFLIVAGLLGLVWAPGVVERTPIDNKTVTYLEGEAGKIDTSTGELVRNPIYAVSESATDTEASTDETVYWTSFSCVMIDRGGERECVDGSDDMITASLDVFATDRHDGLAVNDADALPADAVPHEGLVNKWPFGAEQETYPYWDGTLGEAVDAVYDRTEEVQGVETYVYRVSVDESGVEVAPGTPGRYVTEKQIYVEPMTGAILNQTEDQQRYLADGTPVLDLQVGFTEEQQQTFAADAEDNMGLLRLVTVVIPIVGLVGGPVLVALGAFLALSGRRRSKGTRTADERQLAGV